MTYKRKEVIGDCTLYLGDCLEVMPTLKGVDAVITDPPYIIGIDDFDKKFDIELMSQIIYDILPQDAFFAYFGQMPTIVDFYNASTKVGFVYKDHISWVKRKTTAIFCDLNRTHESIFINKKGNPKINNNKGNYTDVKIDLLHSMPEFIKGIKIYIDDLRNGGVSKIKGKTKSLCEYKYYGNKRDYSRTPKYVNFTNVWSFVSENNISKNTGSIQHMTVKPTKLMMRLVDYLCSVNHIILDAFMGSGSTLVACAKMGRKGIGIEIDERYFNIACQRVEDAYKQGDLFGYDIASK